VFHVNDSIRMSCETLIYFIENSYKPVGGVGIGGIEASPMVSVSLPGHHYKLVWSIETQD